MTNYGVNSTIYGGTSNDSIYNNGASVQIYAESGRDSITNSGGSNVTIDAGAGNDYISNSYYLNGSNYVSVYGGAGNDTIYNYGGYASGLTNYYYYGQYATLNGGTGNDVVSLNSSSNDYAKVQYNSGEGNDTIYGLGYDDTLKISGESYTTTRSGSNLIISVGDNSILVQNGANSSFKIDGTLSSSSSTNTINNLNSNTIISGSSSNDYIFSSGNNVTINALAGNDYIDNQGDTISINAGTDNDTIGSNGAYVSIYGGAGNDTIFNRGKTTGSYTAGGMTYPTYGITDGNFVNGGAGNDYIYNLASNSSIKAGAGNDSIVLSSGAVFIEYDSGDGNDTITGLDSGDTLQITDAEYTTTKSGSDLIVGVGDNSILVQNGANSSFKIDGTLEGNEDEDTLPAGWKFTKTLAAATLTSADDLDLTESYGEDIIRVNASKLTSGVEIIGNDNDNSIKGGKGADTIHGGEGKDTISLGGGADVYVYSGGNDYIRDYAEGTDKISLSSGSISGASVSDSNVILNVSTGGNITLKNADGKSITIIDSRGNETSNVYPIDSEDTLPAGWKFTSTLAAATLTSADDLDLTEEYGADIIRVNVSKLTSGVEIIGNDNDNSIKGGKGADTIHGGEGNDTISLGGGADVYVYSGGNDYIRDYTAGADKISLSSGSISGASVSGSNVILNVSTGGNITLKNAKDKAITIIDRNGRETSNVYPVEEDLPEGISVNGATLTASSSYSGSEIDLADYSGVTRVDASAVSQTLSIIGTSANNYLSGGKSRDTIYGNAGADSIFGNKGNDVLYGDAGNDYIEGGTGADTIYGGAGKDSIFGNNGADKLYGGAGNDYIEGGNGADTIYGGEGNDYIEGGSGRDVFVYANGEGNDIITDYTASDKIQVDGTISNTSYSGNDVIFTIGSGTLTVKDAKGTNISVTDSSGTQTYSRTLDILYDNNFLTDDAALDDITEAKYSVTEIQNSKVEELSQPVLTFAEDK